MEAVNTTTVFREKLLLSRLKWQQELLQHSKLMRRHHKLLQSIQMGGRDKKKGSPIRCKRPTGPTANPYNVYMKDWWSGHVIFLQKKALGG
jgi:hypothetical protein